MFLMRERLFAPAEIRTGHPSRCMRLTGVRFTKKNGDIQPFYTPSKYRRTEVRSELLLELLSSFWIFLLIGMLLIFLLFYVLIFAFCVLFLPLFKFSLKLFNGIGPFDCFCFLIVIHNEVCNCLFQRLKTLKVIRLQARALQNTKPDLHLIKPGSIGR